MIITEEFMLNLVDQDDSADYNDGVYGYPSYYVSPDNVLVVTFYDPETNLTTIGYWQLMLLEMETSEL